MALFANIRHMLLCVERVGVQRHLHVTSVVNKTQAGRHRPSLRRNKPLTYEMAYAPHDIAHRKSWNSWNTSNVTDGNRVPETTIEDVFIRRFMEGTWHNVFLCDIIIKRQHNIIRIAGIIKQTLNPQKMYFLIGYSEELLSYWLQCPIKLELQSVANPKDVIYKYI
ncbi:28S ribosomal protein S24, mitochondrial [Orussus abietinus]|uniref:28S ribosomal protein S24, mitochondrial n=1 Tax=Orussus abietinus TaxID=222816 RepID=UPI000625602F|nr:28S ribosomal protein S24, mitochondrial [Orussus abietinus]